MALDEAEQQRDCDLGRAVHRALLAQLERLVSTGELDLGAPSRLPDWTRAHVLTHLARNADGHRRMIEGAGRGEILEQYELGVVGRTADIESGAKRPTDFVVADLIQATDALEAAWSMTDWEGFGIRTLSGQSPISRLPYLRVREVSLHGVDLDIGIKLADLDPLYVRLELARMEMLWQARQPMGMTPIPNAALQLSPTDRLGWFTGRLVVDGLAPASIF
jgi:maleylpyruvate isomerase